jgi:mannose-6-phosphate isomerase
MVTELAALYPGDPGVVIALLLNRVELHPGEALSLPAGNIHAYLRGVGIELMAASDNVLRGGLTPKHVDTAELARVVDFESLTPTLLRPAELAPGVAVFAPDVPDFELVVIRPQADDSRFALEFDAIVLCIEGSVLVTGATGDRTLLHGDAIYISVDERELRFTGDGRLFLATTNYGSREPLPSRIAPAL